MNYDKPPVAGADEPNDDVSMSESAPYGFPPLNVAYGITLTSDPELRECPPGTQIPAYEGEIGYVNGMSIHIDKEVAEPRLFRSPGDDKWPGSMVRQTVASGDPERAKALNNFITSMADQTHISDLDDACKPGPNVWTDGNYKRDRSGSKKKVPKSVKRAKAKASKRARKAQR